jgi:hypothetical protein
LDGQEDNLTSLVQSETEEEVDESFVLKCQGIILKQADINIKQYQ